MKNNFVNHQFTSNGEVILDIRGFERIQLNVIANDILNDGYVQIDYSQEFNTPINWIQWQADVDTTDGYTIHTFKEADLCINWLKIETFDMAGSTDGYTIDIIASGRGV